MKNSESIQFRKGNQRQEFLEDDNWKGTGYSWQEMAVRELNSHPEECRKKASKFAKQKELHRKENLEKKVPDQYSPENFSITQFRHLEKFDLDRSIILIAISISLALKQEPTIKSSGSPSETLQQYRIYTELTSDLKNAVEKIFPKIEDIARMEAAASYSITDKSLAFFHLPESWMPEDYPAVLEPLHRYLNLDPDEGLEASLLHEMTHAYIQQNTDEEIPIEKESIFSGDGYGIDKEGKENQLNQSAAIDEAAAHAVSKVIDGSKGYNARGYEKKGSGLPRGHVHTALNIFEDVANEETNKHQAIGKIRELAVLSINKHLAIQEEKSKSKIWKHIVELANKHIPSYHKPDTPLEHLKILAKEEISDFNAEKYRKIEVTAETFEETEIKSVNTLASLGFLSFKETMEYGEMLDDSASSLFPGTEVATNPLFRDEEQNFVTVDLKDLEKGFKDVEKLSRELEDKNLKKIAEDLERVFRDYKERKDKIEYHEEEVEKENKKLTAEEEKAIKLMSQYSLTEPHRIEKIEDDLEGKLKIIIDKRIAINEQGIKFAKEVISASEDLEKLLHSSKSYSNQTSEELEKLYKLMERNRDICERALNHLEESVESLNEAKRKLET